MNGYINSAIAIAIDVVSFEELSSDHSPIIVSYNTLINVMERKYSALNNK